MTAIPNFVNSWNIFNSRWKLDRLYTFCENHVAYLLNYCFGFYEGGEGSGSCETNE